MTCTFHLADGQLLLLVDGVEKQSRPIDAPAIATFKGWAARYERCVRDDKRERSVSLDALLAIGREIAACIKLITFATAYIIEAARLLR
jgi:hypothetical protein